MVNTTLKTFFLFLLGAPIFLQAQVYITFLSKSGKYALVDTSGNQIILPVFDDFYHLVNFDRPGAVGNVNGKKRLVLPTGDIFDLQKCEAKLLSDGFLSTKLRLPALSVLTKKPLNYSSHICL